MADAVRALSASKLDSIEWREDCETAPPWTPIMVRTNDGEGEGEICTDGIWKWANGYRLLTRPLAFALMPNNDRFNDPALHGNRPVLPETSA